MDAVGIGVFLPDGRHAFIYTSDALHGRDSKDAQPDLEPRGYPLRGPGAA